MADYDAFALQDEFGDDLDDIATEIAVLRRENARLRAENERLTTFIGWQEGDRVITVADTTGPAGTIPAGTTGTIHQAAEVTVLFDGEDFPCIFGPNGRDPDALAPITTKENP